MAARGERLYTVNDVNWDALPHDTARVAVARYLTGEPAADVAASLGYRPSTIRVWLGSSVTQRRWLAGGELPADELAHLLGQDLTNEKLAAHFGCSAAHVEHEISRLGLRPLAACQVQLRREARKRRSLARQAAVLEARTARRGARAARNRRIVDDYERGDVLGTLAARYNLNPSQIWRVLHAAGVDTSRRAGSGPRGWSPPAEAVG
jgi:hypothetical protein